MTDAELLALLQNSSFERGMREAAKTHGQVFRSVWPYTVPIGEVAPPAVWPMRPTTNTSRKRGK